MTSHRLAYVDDSGRRQPRRFNFTVKRLADLPAPTSGRTWFHDETVPGLAVRVTHTGHASYYHYRKLDGRPVKFCIGDVAAVTLDDARKVAASRNAKYAAGENIVNEKRERREGLTFGDAWQWHLEHHSKPHNRTWERDQQRHDVYLSKWDNRPIADIGGDDVAALLVKIGNKAVTRDGKAYGGKISANRVRALVSAIFNSARKGLGFEGSNPANATRKFRETSRQRYLQPDETPRFFEALNAEPPLIRDFFAMLLYTGARRGNVMAMAWADVDLQSATWRIPMTKTGLPLSLPLTAQAVDILKERHRVNAASETPSLYVFPSRRKAGKFPHFAEPKIAWDRIRERAGLAGMKIHDLRHSRASSMVNAGASLPVVGAMLGHLSTQTTRRYAHLSLETVRAAAAAGDAAMTAAAQPAKVRE